MGVPHLVKDMKKYQTINNISRVRELRNPILNQTLLSFLGELKSFYDIENLAILEISRKDQPLEILVGYTSDDSASFLNEIDLDIGGLLPGVIIETQTAFCTHIYVFDDYSHVMYIELGISKKKEQIVEFAKIVICRISRLFENFIINDRILRVELNIYLKDLVGFYAHEQKNTLATMGMYWGFLKEELTQGNNKTLKFLQSRDYETPFKEISRCLRETSESLNALQASSYYTYLYRKINAIINDVEVFVKFLTRRNANYEFKVSSSSVYSNFEVNGIVQFILISLIRNSIEAIVPSKKKRRNYTITLSILSQFGNQALNFVITDDGPGISPNIIDKVFDPLFSTKNRGSGLGLYLARNLAESIGGQLSLKSAKLSTGSQFQLTVPVKTS